MSTIDEVTKRMQEGMPESSIAAELSGMGIPQSEISNAIAQAKIKSAVSSFPNNNSMTQEIDSGQEDSMANQQYAQQPNYADYATSPQQADYQQYAQQPNYSGYQQQSSLAPDTMNEIAEEVVAEKFLGIKNELEKVIDFRTTVQTKMDYLDERLKRIEKIIDRLQISILQKVGDYLTNTEDIKKEMVEMNKTFKSVSDAKPQRREPIQEK